MLTREVNKDNIRNGSEVPSWFICHLMNKLLSDEKTKYSHQFCQPNMNPLSYSSSTLKPTPSGSTSTTYTTTTTLSHSQLDVIDSADSTDTVHANLAQDSISQIILNTYIPPILKSDTVCRCSPTVFNTLIVKQTAMFYNTGATGHVFYNCCLCHSYKTLHNPIQVNGFNSRLSATTPGRGLVKLQMKVDGRDTLVLLNNVLHVPSTHMNLISGSELDKKGVATWICKGEISLLKSNSVIGRGALWNDLYKLDLIPIPLYNATS